MCDLLVSTFEDVVYYCLCCIMSLRLFPNIESRVHTGVSKKYVLSCQNCHGSTVTDVHTDELCILFIQGFVEFKQ